MMVAAFIPLTPSLRQKLERTIERLIDLLDAIEDDADAEPSLGSVERHPASWERPWRQSGELRHDASGSQIEWGGGETYDGEDDAGENGEPDVDGEPELGFVGHGTGWRDGEHVDDGREYDPADERLHDDSEGEPFLGWSEFQGQNGFLSTGDEFPRR